jgi:hypothetical protein
LNDDKINKLLSLIQNFKPLTSEQGEKILEKLENFELNKTLSVSHQNVV